MAARILEHPLIGWGLGAAKAVPIRPEEMARYLYVSPDGVYPHNQWIEAWLECGLPGVLLGLALLWLTLSRCRSPQAVAATAAALVMSALNFEITTDSWWAALAASALLFRLAGHSLPTRKM
jgi:O-antigen ligase